MFFLYRITIILTRSSQQLNAVPHQTIIIEAINTIERMKIKLTNNDNIHTDISINPKIKLHELYALAVKRKFIPYKQNGVCIMRINGSLQIMIYFEDKDLYISKYKG